MDKDAKELKDTLGRVARQVLEREKSGLSNEVCPKPHPSVSLLTLQTRPFLSIEVYPTPRPSIWLRILQTRPPSSFRVSLAFRLRYTRNPTRRFRSSLCKPHPAPLGHRTRYTPNPILPIRLLFVQNPTKRVWLIERGMQ